MRATDAVAQEGCNNKRLFFSRNNLAAEPRINNPLWKQGFQAGEIHAIRAEIVVHRPRAGDKKA